MHYPGTLRFRTRHLLRQMKSSMCLIIKTPRLSTNVARSRRVCLEKGGRGRGKRSMRRECTGRVWCGVLDIVTSTLHGMVFFHARREISTYLETPGSGFVLQTYVSQVTLTRVYTALQRHTAEGCTVVVNPSRPHGTVSRTSIRVQFCSGGMFVVFPWFRTYRGAHIAIQVARATLPKAVRTCQGQGPRRKVPPGRRFLGRKRRQYAVR